MLETTRLRLYPADRARMEAAIAAEPSPELRAAYTEMLTGCLAHPEQWEWYAMWVIERKDGTPVGDLCFKGLSPAEGASPFPTACGEGVAEVGYGLLEAHRGRGYATEALRAAVAWAMSHPDVLALEAETEPDNAASQRVLAKCGFLPTGETGAEGPRFVLWRVLAGQR